MDGGAQGTDGDILARQAAEGWGAKVIDRLSCDLRVEFPDMQGLSPRNLKYMRTFAEAWPDRTIVQRTIAQLGGIRGLSTSSQESPITTPVRQVKGIP